MVLGGPGQWRRHFGDWAGRQEVASLRCTDEQTSVPNSGSGAAGLLVISHQLPLPFFDENNYAFSILRKARANPAARQVSAPLQGGWPQHLPAHRRAPDALMNRPRPRARPRPCGAVDASDSAVRAPPTAPGAPPVGCHSGLRPTSGRSLRPALWAHARPAPPAAPTRRRPRPPGSARAGAGACVSVRERARRRRLCRCCSRALCHCPHRRLRCRRRRRRRVPRRSPG